MAVLELLGEGVQVVRVLSRGAGDVKDGDLGAVSVDVQVGHVRHAALQEQGVVVLDQVRCQAGLALAANGVHDPHDGPVVGLVSQDVQDVALPWARLKGLVVDLGLAQLQELLEAPLVLDHGRGVRERQIAEAGA